MSNGCAPQIVPPRPPRLVTVRTEVRVVAPPPPAIITPPAAVPQIVPPTTPIVLLPQGLPGPGGATWSSLEW